MTDTKQTQELVERTNTANLLALDMIAERSRDRKCFAGAAWRLAVVREKLLVAVRDLRIASMPEKEVQLPVPFGIWEELAAMNPWCVCRSH